MFYDTHAVPNNVEELKHSYATTVLYTTSLDQQHTCRFIFLKSSKSGITFTKELTILCHRPKGYCQPYIIMTFNCSLYITGFMLLTVNIIFILFFYETTTNLYRFSSDM